MATVIANPFGPSVLKKLMTAAVPEQKDVLTKIFDKYAPLVWVAEDRHGTTMEAYKSGYQFDQKTLSVYWLISFSAWEAINCYSPGVFMSVLTKSSLKDTLSDDFDLPRIESDYKARLGMAQRIISEPRLNLSHWPPDIPYPVVDSSELGTVEEKTAFDLTIFAIAYIFLHETRHINFFNDGDKPSERIEEEVFCDVFAREFMTTKIEAYANKSGEKYEDVLCKRSMGIAIACLILNEITPVHNRSGSATHPPIYTRIETLIANTPLEENSMFWVYTASILLGLLRREHVTPDIIPSSAKQLTEELIGIAKQV